MNNHQNFLTTKENNEKQNLQLNEAILKTSTDPNDGLKFASYFTPNNTTIDSLDLIKKMKEDSKDDNVTMEVAEGF